MKSPMFTQKFISGPAGQLDTLILDTSLDNAPQGIALVAHPNPTQGGTNTNKVVHTLAKALSRQGYIAVCPNLRGVGQSDGEHDFGQGEVDDMAAVFAWAQAQFSVSSSVPSLILAGFSFGTFVQAQFSQRLLQNQPDAVAQHILVGTAANRWEVPPVPANTLLIHGEMDDVCPLSSVFDWVRPQNLPVVVVPGAGHFFHGKLMLLADIVRQYMVCHLATLSSTSPTKHE